MTLKQTQQLLGYLGYYGGAADGEWGNISREAARAFQSAAGITADGVPGPETAAALKQAVAEDRLCDDFWAHIRYWTREEFRCRCGEYHAPYCDGFPAEPDRTLVALADDIRRDLGAPAIRSSGIRCKKHNEDSGGVSNSRHLSGKALDFMVQGVSASKVLTRAQSDPRCRYAYIIGNGPYVHIDVE